MAHLDNTDHYRVYDGEDKPLKFRYPDTALAYAVKNNPLKVVLFNAESGVELDATVGLAVYWASGLTEVPSILPDFINEHKSDVFNVMLELKRNQQLGRV